MVRGDRREMQTQHHEIVRVQLGIYENCTARIACRLLQVKIVWNNSEVAQQPPEGSPPRMARHKKKAPTRKGDGAFKNPKKLGGA